MSEHIRAVSPITGVQVEIMNDVSILVGGRAGDGINSAGLIVAHLLNHIGYRVYMYFDYPSLIKGGHNFALVRGSGSPVGAHRNRADFILALNQDSIDLHGDLIRDETTILFDSGRVDADGIPVPVSEILKELDAPAVMGNSCIIGAFARSAGIEWAVLESVFRQKIPKGLEKNLQVARRGYDAAHVTQKIEPIGRETFPILTGNEAIGIGLLHGGLDAFVAYPMTPTSNILHFLAESAVDLPLDVVHPENEIAVFLMALGFAYAGKKAAVCTSGGGFCLMTEGFSLAGMAELPIVVVMGQRTGPSTGVPTYTAQTDLHFMIHAGHGEFPRLVVAPGDAAQAFTWSSLALSMAWKYQVPAIILADKTLCEGSYSFEQRAPPDIGEADSRTDPGEYRRYALTGDGISPMLHPPAPGAVIKMNGYAHDEAGITTEDADTIRIMTDKRKQKSASLKAAVEDLGSVIVRGKADASTAILCWGSNLSVCTEVADSLGLRLIQPVVLWPFPVETFQKALSGVERLVLVEDSAYGQLSMLISGYGFPTDDLVLRYDGRPNSVEELVARIQEVLA